MLKAIPSAAPITNAHTHLGHGWLANCCPGVAGVNFFPWIAKLTEQITERRRNGDWQSIQEEAARAGIQQLIEAGTTTVGEISSHGISVGPLLESGLRGAAFVEVSCPNSARVDEKLNWVRAIIDRWRPKENGRMRVGLGIHATYSVHPLAWESLLDYARQEALPVTIHVAESREEYEYLLHDTEAGIKYVRQIGADFPSPRKSPVHYLDDLGALDLKPLLVHAVQVDDDDIRRIKASGSTVVHCPRSNLRLRCGRMPLEKYLKAGVPVLLGTDGLTSSPSLNVLDDMEIAAALHHGRVEPQIIADLIHQLLPV